MINTTRLDKYDESFLTFEPMWAESTRTKVSSGERFAKMFGQKKNYQKPKYSVANPDDLKNALTLISAGEKKQDNYSTSKGIYRERMRVLQSLTDRRIDMNMQLVIRAGYEDLYQMMNADRRDWEERR